MLARREAGGYIRAWRLRREARLRGLKRKHDFLPDDLARLGHFVHCAQAARTDIHVLCDAVYCQATVLDIQHKPAIGMPL